MEIKVESKLKSVESFSDVICENCFSFNEGRCCKELPAIPVGRGKRCSEGSWLFKGNVISFRQICLKLVPFDFVTDVEDLLCKNCVFYRPSRRECHFHRKDVYKSAPMIGVIMGRGCIKKMTMRLFLFHYLFFTQMIEV